MYFCTYVCVQTSVQNIEQVAHDVEELAKFFQVQMKTSLFHLLDPISIIAFLSLIKLCCNKTSIHKVAEI